MTACLRMCELMISSPSPPSSGTRNCLSPASGTSLSGFSLHPTLTTASTPLPNHPQPPTPRVCLPGMAAGQYSSSSSSYFYYIGFSLRFHVHQCSLKGPLRLFFLPYGSSGAPSSALFPCSSNYPNNPLQNTWFPLQIPSPSISSFSHLLDSLLFFSHTLLSSPITFCFPSLPHSCFPSSGIVSTTSLPPVAARRCRRCTNTTLKATQW